MKGKSICIGDFMLSTAAPNSYQDEIFKRKLAEKLAEYGARIEENDKDYEAYVCRAFTLLTSLSHDGTMQFQAARYGFNVYDKDGTIEFTRCPLGSFDALMRENNEIDEACEIAVPVLKEVLADLGKVSKDWTDGMEVSEAKGYSVNETVYFDYADSLLARAAISEMISVLYLMKGYNTLTADWQPKDIDRTALKEAQRWTYSAAVLVNAFTGWSPSGVILPGTAETLEFTANFDPLPPAGPPEGGEGNPWRIGATANDTVVAWTNGTELVIEGKGAMKDFGAVAEGRDSTGEVAPWAKCDIVLATVGSDVTSLGNAAFADSPTGEGAEIVFRNPAAVISIGAFVGDGGSKTNVPAVKVETVDKDGQVRRDVPVGFRDVADRQRVYPTLQAAIDAGASAVTPRIRPGVIIVFR